MQRFKPLPIVLFLFLVNTDGWALQGTQLDIRVHLPDGNPARGIKVQLVQLERASPRNLLCGKTNDNGMLAVHFEPVPTLEGGRNGWGIYRFVLMPDSFRWELSDLYYWSRVPEKRDYLQSDEIASESWYRDVMRRNSGNNWSIGSLIRVQDGTTLVWNVTLQRGKEVHISVVDQFGKALPKSGFRVFLDTKMLSHTGWGGEIPLGTAATDDRGVFILPKVGEFFYSFDYEPVKADVCQYCSSEAPFFSTVVLGRFQGTTGTIIYLKRVPRNLILTVIDKTTKQPIPDAAIADVVSFNSAAQDGPPMGRTDKGGHFHTDRLLTEHVLFLRVCKDGYADFEFDMKNFQSGAAYVIELQRK
jgi:hypothetical protein